jgi:hypothetical protein
MKKLIIFLALLVTIPVFGQMEMGRGYAYSDSLYQDLSGVSDTTFIMSLGFQYDWLTITMVDTGSTYTDSLVAEHSSYTVSLKSSVTTRVFEIADTVWSDVAFMKDSTWSDVDVMANAGAVTSYTIFVGDCDKVRIRMINVEAVSDRVCYFKAMLSRK